MGQELCYYSAGLDSIAFGPEKFSGLSGNRLPVRFYLSLAFL